MIAVSNTLEVASDALTQGRSAEAVSLLERAGRAGNAAAWTELALWWLQGLTGVRDLARSRASFAAAAALGDRQARMIHLSFIAQGIGGAADWAHAMHLLCLAAADDQDAATQVELIAAMRLDEQGSPLSLPSARCLSGQPLVHLFPGLLSATEAAMLISLARPALSPSVVVDPHSGRAIPNPIRTSDSCSFPYLSETPFIHALNCRLAAASGTRVEAGEPLQVLRYRPAQEYKPHFDALPGTDNQRMRTMLIYLNDGYSGGATKFMATGLTVTGSVGDALLFRNADEAGRADPSSQHAGLPVASGEKYLASRWIHQRQFGPR